jgi:hypothetical protein
MHTLLYVSITVQKGSNEIELSERVLIEHGVQRAGIRQVWPHVVRPTRFADYQPSRSVLVNDRNARNRVDIDRPHELRNGVQLAHSV